MTEKFPSHNNKPIAGMRDKASQSIKDYNAVRLLVAPHLSI